MLQNSNKNAIKKVRKNYMKRIRNKKLSEGYVCRRPNEEFFQDIERGRENKE